MSRTLSRERTNRITASRLPAVLGISPYTTRAALMREMVRQHFDDPEEFAGSFITDWGQNHEDNVIAEYEMTRGVRVYRSGADQLTLVHPTIDYLAATPDGVTRDRVVECKAPWRSLYTSLNERPDFFAQLQMQMEVTGHNLADLVIWRPQQQLAVTTVERDPKWLDTVLPAINEFLDEYRATVADPERYTPHREPLKDVRTDEQWAIQAREWLEADFLVRQLTAARDAAAAKLAELAPKKSARGAGIDFLRFERKGPVQYKALVPPEIDVEPHRGPATQVISVRRIGAPK